MKKILLLILLIPGCLINSGAADLNKNLIAVAKVYGDFMFRNNATETAFKELDKIDSPELNGTVRFIRETITTNNKLTK